MKVVIGLLLSVIFLFLSGIHIYWGLGGKWGADAAIPRTVDKKKLILPGFVACFAVALAFLAAAVFCLIKVNLVSVELPRWLSVYGLWPLAGVFIIRAVGEFKYLGFFKKVRDTKFGQMDTMYYSPLCLLIGSLLVALQVLS